MSSRTPPQPTLFLTRQDQAVLAAAEAYVLGAPDGHKAERRHRLQKAVLERWWANRRTPLAQRRRAIVGAA